MNKEDKRVKEEPKNNTLRGQRSSKESPSSQTKNKHRNTPKRLRKKPLFGSTRVQSNKGNFTNEDAASKSHLRAHAVSKRNSIDDDVFTKKSNHTEHKIIAEKQHQEEIQTTKQDEAQNPPLVAIKNDDKPIMHIQTINAVAERQEIRGKKAPPHLSHGIVLCNRLRIDRMMGGGGFGQVFKAIDQSNNKVVAVKVEPCDRESGRMILEQKVLNLLRGTKHAPKLIASGNYGSFMFIAMEMLGRNLTDLRHRQPSKRFSIGTGLRVAVQMIEALKDIHAIAFLHRDVKPSNMCVGFSEEARKTIFLVDFGMTRRFKTETGEFRKSRTYAGFRGTIRYVSLTVHERRDQGPMDDLWSLLYSIIELCEGGLPWKHMEDDEDMAQKKKRTPLEEMLMNLPSSIKEVGIYLETLSYDSIPDYDLVSQFYTEAMPNDVTPETPFDWEALNPSSKSLELESTSNQL